MDYQIYTVQPPLEVITRMVTLYESEISAKTFPADTENTDYVWLLDVLGMTDNEFKKQPDGTYQIPENLLAGK